MKYTRLYEIPEKKSSHVTFKDAKDGSAYKNPNDGSVRVKVGEMYLLFTKINVVGYHKILWPINILPCDEISVSLSLCLKGQRDERI